MRMLQRGVDITYSDRLVLYPALLAGVCDASFAGQTNPAANVVRYVVHLAQ
jgi:hypothetical protein